MEHKSITLTFSQFQTFRLHIKHRSRFIWTEIADHKLCFNTCFNIWSTLLQHTDWLSKLYQLRKNSHLINQTPWNHTSEVSRCENVSSDLTVINFNSSLSMVKQFAEQQVDDLIKLKFGRLVTSANHISYVSNATLGTIFGISASKVCQLYNNIFKTE